MPKTILVSSEVQQPTFGDTDDELGVTKQPRKKQKAESKKAKVLNTRRLQIASRSTIHGVLEQLDCMGYKIRVYPLNYAIKVSGVAAEVVPCHTYRKGSPAEDYDVAEEKDGWDAGHAEMEGIAVLSYEIAEWLCEDETNSVVVVSNVCGDAARLLAGCTAQAVRRVLGKTSESTTEIIGSQASKPRCALLRKVYEDFGKWTKITARANICDVLS